MATTITLYLVGWDKEDAKKSLVFDSYESARSYQLDNLGQIIYTVTAKIDYTTMVVCDEDSVYG